MNENETIAVTKMLVDPVTVMSVFSYNVRESGRDTFTSVEVIEKLADVLNNIQGHPCKFYAPKEDIVAALRGGKLNETD